jgi:nucleoside-diphosphate-sugar epimerase
MPGSHPNPGRPAGPVLVTGASGTIGRRLVPALVAAGHQVRAMIRSDAAAQMAAAACAEPVYGDVTDPASLSAAVRGCQVVIHAAGRMGASPAAGAVLAGERHRDPEHAGRGGRCAGAPVHPPRRGDEPARQPRPVTGADESWPLQQPRCSGYAASKTRADQAVQAANGTQMATVVIRPGWVWGTAGHPSAASFVQAVRAGQMRLIDGGRHRSWRQPTRCCAQYSPTISPGPAPAAWRCQADACRARLKPRAAPEPGGVRD